LPSRRTIARSLTDDTIDMARDFGCQSRYDKGGRGSDAAYVNPCPLTREPIRGVHVDRVALAGDNVAFNDWETPYSTAGLPMR